MTPGLWVGTPDGGAGTAVGLGLAWTGSAVPFRPLGAPEAKVQLWDCFVLHLPFLCLESKVQRRGQTASPFELLGHQPQYPPLFTPSFFPKKGPRARMTVKGRIGLAAFWALKEALWV